MNLKRDLVNDLVPILGRSLESGFNVFDVMHHGTHEKQLSNVFSWLLDAGGTHDLGEVFASVFIAETKSAMPGAEALPLGGYHVRQEVDTAPAGYSPDIADLVLENDAARIVIENYYTSDGHGHSYQGYVDYSRRDGHHGVVVLLCRQEDRNRLMHGWHNARVLTYRALINKLHEKVSHDQQYQRDNPEVYMFIQQMHRKFVTERDLVSDRDIVQFLTAMSHTDEAERYGAPRHDEVAEQFASDVAVQARQRFVESREMLQHLKVRLRSFCDGPLSSQLENSLEKIEVRNVSMSYAGIYQWTIDLDLAGIPSTEGRSVFQLKFGPSAWFAQTRNPYWTDKPAPDSVDFSYVFVTRPDTKVLRQSTVSLYDLLDGLEPTDARLHDAIIELY